MKSISRPWLTLILLLGLVSACHQADPLEAFVVPGGITYTGKATSPLVHVGRNRVQISWLRGTDPTVTKARIFWNNFADSVQVAIPPSGQTISTIIENLPERTYNFTIITYDEKGNFSVPVEVIAATYGEKFQNRLLSRPLNQAVLDDLGLLSLKWGAADISGGAYATEVEYTNQTGNVQVKRFPVGQASSPVTDFKAGTPLKYRTLYLPGPLSIDTFYTAYQQQSQYLFDKTNWGVTAFSTQHSGAANLAANAIDGLTDTRWHTISNASSKYPHFITVDMKMEKTVTAFEIFRMKDDDRACDRFQLLTSKDNKTWTDQGSYDFNRLSNSGQLFLLPGTAQARYFKFVGLSGPQGFMVIGEINVHGL
ncbi:MAG: DUF4998 domain-containing protein [Adhaeribacter sp.]